MSASRTDIVSLRSFDSKPRAVRKRLSACSRSAGRLPRQRHRKCHASGAADAARNPHALFPGVRASPHPWLSSGAAIAASKRASRLRILDDRRRVTCQRAAGGPADEPSALRSLRLRLPRQRLGRIARGAAKRAPLESGGVFDFVPRQRHRKCHASGAADAARTLNTSRFQGARFAAPLAIL